MSAVLNFFSGDKSVSDKLCDFIIRPPRSNYTLSDLGPKKFRLNDQPHSPHFLRRDLKLVNMRGFELACSWYVPAYMGDLTEPRRPPRTYDPGTGKSVPSALPCVVYCHANCGSRYDGLEALFLLDKGFTLFTFDFCGSGHSDGEYISLGVYERQDLAAVVEFLSLEKEVKRIALWGRSMGAVTAIMYASKDPFLSCIVCDSPFASLDLLVRDIVDARVTPYFPNFILKAVMESFRRNIERRAAFDIAELDTTKYAPSCRVPALLLHGESDDFVDVKHTYMLRDWYAEDVPCIHHLLPGGHNSRRDPAHNLIVAFLTLYLVDKPEAGLTPRPPVATTPASRPSTSPAETVVVSNSSRHRDRDEAVPAGATAVVVQGAMMEQPASQGVCVSSSAAVGGGAVLQATVVRPPPMQGQRSSSTLGNGSQQMEEEEEDRSSDDLQPLMERHHVPATSPPHQTTQSQSRTAERHTDPDSFSLGEQKPIEFTKPTIFE